MRLLYLEGMTYMGEIAFIYLTNVILNLFFVLPVILFVLLIGSVVKVCLPYSISHRLPDFLEHYRWILILFVVLFLFIPTREMVLTKAEMIAEERFLDNQKSLINIYEFLSRARS
jgi:hypothetical protein